MWHMRTLNIPINGGGTYSNHTHNLAKSQCYGGLEVAFRWHQICDNGNFYAHIP